MTGFVPVGHVVLEETSGAACAVASWDGWLHLAWTGSDTRLNVMVSADGMSFANKATLRHRSCRTESSGDSTRTVSLAPALTPSELGLIIGWTGTDHQLNILQVGAPENRNSVIPQRSAMGPALTARGSELVVGWTGTDRRLNLISAYQRGLSAPLTLGHKSGDSPALATVGSELLMAWAGGGRRLNVLPVGTAPHSPPWFPGSYTNRKPAMCAIGDELVLAWRDPDRHLCLQTVSAAGVWGPPVGLPMTSFHGPSICCHRNTLVLAWTGSDRRINVMLLRAG